MKTTARNIIKTLLTPLFAGMVAVAPLTVHADLSEGTAKVKSPKRLSG